MENMNKIIHEGEIDLAGIIIPCYVLEDGTRILSGSAMQKSLKLQEDSDNKSGTRLARYLGQKSLEPFIYKGKEPGHFDPIQCYRGEQKINGYEATVLADICESFLDARNEIKLSSRQALIAEQCEILIRGFARVGIVALVDEATGYQYDRERFELQKILNTYISEEILKWQLTFTDDFYKQIYRLWNLPFIPKYIKNKPSFIGRLTTKYIYEQLPDGVLENLRKNTPKTEKGNWKYKFHQSLTPEVGKEHLKKQITEVTTLMEISKNKKEFEDFFERKYGDNSQLELEFGEQ
ncbi:hypothetical protein G1L01_13805 [Tenacibaculum finnmarkense]|nr:hypothetical protein [Tenacibaculum finnmarkense]MCG8716663.1 hypothetical protein [Tenacibaculum finnmarkense]MCG8719328.1 hypothetical protein [Tenacibaculum finnmarkense]MCG8721857.1 hypothetical protein [Tenacibaculum finnmarkense]MCG8727072.1 hypothetical protein [Tenacibaculum finnmarkense]